MGQGNIPTESFIKTKHFHYYTNPLEFYFEKYPEKRPKTEIMSTALWRGYVATFEIVDNQLKLKDIEIQVNIDTGSFKTAWKSVLTEVFPNESERKINWFSGLLILPYGNRVDYVHMGYGSTYENYYIVEISEGSFIQDRQFNNKQFKNFKEAQFQEFKKTDEYKRLVESLRKDATDTQESLDDFIRSYAINYTSKILTKD